MAVVVGVVVVGGGLCVEVMSEGDKWSGGGVRLWGRVVGGRCVCVCGGWGG